MNLTRWQRPDLSYWEPFRRLSSLREELDRFFDRPVTGLTPNQTFFDGWVPTVDMHEDRDNYVVTVEVPGMRKEDIEISLHQGALSISGERKASEKYNDAQVQRSERFVGRFQRTIALPSEVEGDKVSAAYKDGVLTITLPKAEEAKPKQIRIETT